MKKYLFFILIVFISCQKNDKSDSQIDPEDLPEKIFYGSLINPSIDDLQYFYNENYTKVVGEIKITSADSIPNLLLLKKLRSIEGDLSLVQLDIENLEGLNNLERVDGEFFMFRINSNDLSGLDKLHFVDTFVLRDLYVTNLKAFSNLQEAGFLWLDKLKIEDLDGLDNLKTVNRTFYLHNCSSLKNLSGANSLTNLNSNLTIDVADSLEDIKLIPDIEKIPGNLSISNCMKLKKISGFSNLKSIGGELKFGNVGIENFDGLNNLENIGQSFILYDMPIINFTGLEKLKAVQQSFNIRECSKLINLNGLGNLDYVGNTLEISTNDKLATLDGINPNISYIKRLIVVVNFNLTDFCSLSDYIIEEGPDYDFTTSPNAYSPDYEDFVNGDCLQ